MENQNAQNNPCSSIIKYMWITVVLSCFLDTESCGNVNQVIRLEKLVVVLAIQKKFPIEQSAITLMFHCRTHQSHWDTRGKVRDNFPQNSCNLRWILHSYIQDAITQDRNSREQQTQDIHPTYNDVTQRNVHSSTIFGPATTFSLVVAFCSHISSVNIPSDQNTNSSCSCEKKKKNSFIAQIAYRE